MKLARTRSLFGLGLLFPIFLAGCSSGTNSGGSGGGTPPPPNARITSVTVSCNATTVPTAQTTQCAATVTGTGSYSSAVTWSVNNFVGGNSTVGPISSTGLYTAPSTVPTPFTTTITATSAADTTKSASVPIIVAGTIATASQAISAASGGTITLPDGSSVTINPGTLSADTTVTLSKVSVVSSQPNNPAIESVGPALVLDLATPTHFMLRSSSSERLATVGVRPRGVFSSGLHFVINVAGNVSAGLTNSVPMASLISSTNGAVANFVGAVGAFDATAQTVTGDVSGYALHAAGTGVGFVSSVEMTAQNFVLAKLQTYFSQNSLALNIVPSNPLADTWVSYTGCPTGKTLLVVHGMNSSVTGTYPTADSTIQNIKETGGYDAVVGYDYDWTNAIDASGVYVAAFLNTLAQCPAVASIDVEAHSEGVAVTLSALTDVTASTRQKIKRVVAVAGPIMGTPMANFADLASYLASQSSVVLASQSGLAGLASEGMAYVLSQPFVHDLMVSVPGDNSKLDIIRRTVSPYSIGNAPQIFVVAGNAPGSMQRFADMMSLNGVNYSDGFIPLSSALAFQNNSSNLPVLKVYPLYPFPGNHTQLIGSSSLVGLSVAHAVGAQVNTSAMSPTLSLSSVPACTNSIVCSGMAGTYFTLSGSGLTNNDTYTLYQQDDTGNVSTSPKAASFIASNATVPPNTWQDTTDCSVRPRTIVLFAQDTNSSSPLASNAVTEQVVAGTCIAPNPAPSIVSLSPPSLPVGSSIHTLTISGSGFTSGSTVTFNGISHTPTFISSSQLTIVLTASDIATAGLFPVVVTNPAPGGGSSNSANFTITSGTATITISPTSVSLGEGGSQIFTATVSGGGGVNWSIQEGSSGGTIVVSGLSEIPPNGTPPNTYTANYFAPNTSGTFHVVASSTADSSLRATATVSVTAPASGVTLSPSQVTVPEGGVQTFTALASSGGGVTWSVQEGNSGGTITSTGIYTAPTTAGTFHVLATSVADSSQSATATVSIISGASYKILHVFGAAGGEEGVYPDATLIQGADGLLYGTTQYGPEDGGTIFKIDTSSSFTSLGYVSSGHSQPGPVSSLIKASDGNLYGTSALGSEQYTYCVPYTTFRNGCGLVFKVDTSGNISALHYFSVNDVAVSPHAALIQAKDGNFYGTTYYGGNYSCDPNGQGCGTVIKMDSSGNVTVLHSFSGPDGSYPSATLIQGSDGSFYGTSSAGGNLSCGLAIYSTPGAGCGTVFKIDSAGHFTVLHTFSLTDGGRPLAALIQANDGNIYGTTARGGSLSCASNYGPGQGCGTVFKIDMLGNFTLLHSFTGPDGNFPVSSLLQAKDGYFYGTTWAGGDMSCGTYMLIANYPYLQQAGCGAIYRMDAAGNVTILHDFGPYQSDGVSPVGGLVQGTDGNLYGTTFYGDPYYGVIFQISTIP